MQGQHRLHQGKFVPYDPSTQVPLLIRGPGIPAGSQPRSLVWNGDITSTILQMTGAKPGLPQDGQSMLPLAQDPAQEVDSADPLRDRAPPGRPSSPDTGTAAAASGRRARSRSSTYVKNTDLDHTAQISRAIVAPRYRAIRTGRYLLTKYSDGGRELYDISTRPADAATRSGRTAATRRSRSSS